jgi:hypothetical protein
MSRFYLVEIFLSSWVLFFDFCLEVFPHILGDFQTILLLLISSFNSIDIWDQVLYNFYSFKFVKVCFMVHVVYLAEWSM